MRGILTWIAIAAAVAVTGAARAQRQQQAGAPDQERARAIAEQLRDDPQLKDDHVVIEVDGKRVTLRGQVDSADERRHAEDVVRRSDPTLEVDDQLQVPSAPERAAPASPSLGERAKEDARAAGAEISDAWVTTKLKSKIIAERGLDANGVGVTTERHVVTLTGQVRSEADRRRVIDIARHTDGVMVVIDQMKVATAAR